MSQIKVDLITNKEGTGSPVFPFGFFGSSVVVVENLETRTAVNGDTVILRFGAGTQTLPASPQLGAIVVFIDGFETGSIEDDPVIIERNGELINGSATNFTFNAEHNLAKFIFLGGSRGWQVFFNSFWSVSE